MSVVELVCTGRARPHRRVLVYRYCGPMPPPAQYRWTVPSATFELACTRCGLNLRPGDEAMRRLLTGADTLGGVLDLARLPR